jgi:hypothetical protein
MTRFTRDPLYRRHRFPAEVFAACDDRRQASILWCGEAGDHARRRASLAPGPEQSGGEFSSTRPTRGEDHEALQVSATSSAFRFHPRPDCQPLSRFPPRYSIRPPSRTASGSLGYLAPNRTSSHRMNQGLTPRSCFQSVKFTVPSEFIQRLEDLEAIRTPTVSQNIASWRAIGGRGERDSNSSYIERLCRQLRNGALHQSQESGVACPRNQRSLRYKRRRSGRGAFRILVSVSPGSGVACPRNQVLSH